MKKIMSVMCIVIVGLFALTGCGNSEPVTSGNSLDTNQVVDNVGETSNGSSDSVEVSSTNGAVETLYVNFGESAYFPLHLNDSATAQKIAEYVGTEDWQLPIYHFDDYDNWEIMQFYDVPQRYEIPAAPENITEEKAGTVYYSDPNRIILYFGDGQVSAEYTPIGYFDMSNELEHVVKNNPVLEGWGNKLIHITATEK